MVFLPPPPLKKDQNQILTQSDISGSGTTDFSGSGTTGNDFSGSGTTGTDFLDPELPVLIF